MSIFEWHWLYVLWFGYAWSSDKGNGPEALQQTILYGAIALLFVPIVRKAIKRWSEKLHEKLDHNAVLLKHIIKHHPDIPNEDYDGKSLVDG